MTGAGLYLVHGAAAAGEPVAVRRERGESEDSGQRADLGGCGAGVRATLVGPPIPAAAAFQAASLAPGSCPALEKSGCGQNWPIAPYFSRAWDFCGIRGAGPRPGPGRYPGPRPASVSGARAPRRPRACRTTCAGARSWKKYAALAKIGRPTAMCRQARERTTATPATRPREMPAGTAACP